jgi:hypothetical protein
MEFVTFELAKKLKDLGYNVPFFFFYRTDDQLIHHAVIGQPLVYGKYVDNEVVIAPTISQVLNWLGVEKQIYILVEPFPSMATKDKVCWTWSFKWDSDGVNFGHTLSADCTYLTSKEAALAAIEYVLNNMI